MTTMEAAGAVAGVMDILGKKARKAKSKAELAVIAEEGGARLSAMADALRNLAAMEGKDE